MRLTRSAPLYLAAGLGAIAAVAFFALREAPTPTAAAPAQDMAA